MAVEEPRITELQRKTTLHLNLPMFMILRPIGHHGSCLCLWLLILLSLLLPCTSTIVPGTTFVSKVAAWPGSLEGSLFSLCRRIPCLVLLLQRMSSIPCVFLQYPCAIYFIGFVCGSISSSYSFLLGGFWYCFYWWSHFGRELQRFLA